MPTRRPASLSLRSGAFVLILALLAPALLAQTGQRVPREQMWYAPTAVDWKKPVLIRWQRTWEDALRVAKETGKPILICVNMDGEIASEHYAGVRYRQKDKAKLYEPYVCVVASVYRHNARDYDEQGNRIPCPRFGCVTCGEHITIEPILFKKYFDGQRIAPRHIMVELDGKETYDVMLTFDTDSVFTAIREGITKRKKGLTKEIRSDRTIFERVASQESADREAVEKAFKQGDAKMRMKLLDLARKHQQAGQVDLMRLGVFSLNQNENKAARDALAASSVEGAADVINEALRVPLQGAEKKNLITALKRIGEKSARARTLAVVHEGLSTRSSVIDTKGVADAYAGSTYPAPKGWEKLESQVDKTAKATQAKPKDAKSHVDLAVASLALAVNPETNKVLTGGLQTGRTQRAAKKYARLMLLDAQRAAREAQKLGAKDWRADAVLSVVAYYTEDQKEAYARAAAAVQSLPKGDTSWNSMAVLDIFVESRRNAILDAVRAKKNWPGQWMSDMHSAYSVLAHHPLGTERHIIMHFDFLKWLGAKGQASRALEQGLKRFPDSGLMHDRLRGWILAERGVKGLEAEYQRRMRAPNASKNTVWFAGYASIVAAEFHRRRGRRTGMILGAYDRAIAHFDKAIQSNPKSKDSADYFAAIAMAGRARVEMENGDLERAIEELIGCFKRKPRAAAGLDGLNLTPVQTANTLMNRCRQADLPDLAARVQAALNKLDPKLLRAPEYDNVGPVPGRNRRGGNQRGGGNNRRRRDR